MEAQIHLGEELKQEGIKKALRHANKQLSSWGYAANFYFFEYVRKKNYKPFICEEVVLYAENQGLPKPPTRRAWGAIMHRLKAKGFIEFDTIVKSKNPKHHRGHKTQWKPIKQV